MPAQCQRRGAGDVPPNGTVAQPVTLPGKDSPRIYLVAAINPHKKLDASSHEFLDLVVRPIATALARAIADQETRARVEAPAEPDCAKTVLFRNVSHGYTVCLSFDWYEVTIYIILQQPLLGSMEDTSISADPCCTFGKYLISSLVQ